MTEHKSAMILIKDLKKSFNHNGKNIKVLTGLNLEVKKNEMCAIVGESGAGKSTLLHLIGTLDVPTSGTVIINGQNVTDFAEKKLASFRNKTIGFVFQFHHLLPEFTAMENTMMPGFIGKMNNEEIEDMAVHILKEVGLGDRMSHKPGELSGGEQQRVALARALVLKPDVLLADEPTGNLDAKISGAIHELFFKMNETYHTTMLMVTHNTELAKMMQRTLLLKKGKISE